MGLPSGKLSHNYRKSPFLIGKSTNCWSLPEGNLFPPIQKKSQGVFFSDGSNPGTPGPSFLAGSSGCSSPTKLYLYNVRPPFDSYYGLWYL